jgi:hypothetical protein
MKTPVTPPGTKPVTFRLVAQCLNQLRHHVPQTRHVNLFNLKKKKLSSFQKVTKTFVQGVINKKTDPFSCSGRLGGGGNWDAPLNNNKPRSVAASGPLVESSDSVHRLLPITFASGKQTNEPLARSHVKLLDPNSKKGRDELQAEIKLCLALYVLLVSRVYA